MSDSINLHHKQDTMSEKLFSLLVEKYPEDKRLVFHSQFHSNVQLKIISSLLSNLRYASLTQFIANYALKKWPLWQQRAHDSCGKSLAAGVLTDTGGDSKLVQRRKRPKVDPRFSSLFCVASERRVWLSA